MLREGFRQSDLPPAGTVRSGIPRKEEIVLELSGVKVLVWTMKRTRELVSVVLEQCGAQVKVVSSAAEGDGFLCNGNPTS